MARPRGTRPVPVEPVSTPAPAPSGPSRYSHLLYPALLLLVAAGLFHRQWPREGVCFTVAAVLVLCFQFLAGGNGTSKAGERTAWVLGFAFWVLGCLALLSFPNFSYVFGKISLPLDRAYWLWFLSLIVAVFLFHRLPREKAPLDLSPAVSRSLLFLILMSALFLRMYRPETPGGCYWDDWSVEVVDPLNMAAFHEFHFLFPIGKREPFFSYFMMAVWWVLPNASMIFVQRLTCTLLDLSTIILLYFLGKELKSRFTGLVAAALGAISIPLIVKCINGMRLVSLPMAVALLSLSFFRVVRRPTLGRFLLWGLAVGFGTYTYTGFRIWIFYAIFILLAWILWESRGKIRIFPPFTKAAMGLAGLLTVVLFFQANGYLSSGSPLSKFLLGPVFELTLACALLAVLLAATFPRKTEEGKAALGWAWGSFVGLVTAYPILVQKEITDRMRVLTIFHDPQYNRFAFSSLVHLFNKLMVALRTTFFTWEGDVERSDLGIRWDSLFDFHALVLFFLGLAFFLSRPSKRLAFLVAGIFVGISPYVFSFDPHSGKLVGCIVPVLAVGAWGWTTLLEHAQKIFSKPGPWTAALLTVAFLAYGGKVNFQECYPQLFKPQYPNVLVSHQATEDAKRYRVFLAPYENHFGAATALTQTVLEERNHVRLILPSNPIYLRPGGAEKDISVQVPYGSPALFDQIRKEFPGATWSDIRADWWATSPPVIHRGIIPFHDLPDQPGKLFYVQHISNATWVREFYDVRAGIARGVIAEEDDLPLSSPIPAGLGGEVSARFQGFFHADSDGLYKFSVSSGNYVILKVDGKKLIDMRPRPVGVVLSRSRSIHLSQGDHRAEYLIYYQNGRSAPPIQVTPPNGPSLTLGTP